MNIEAYKHSPAGQLIQVWQADVPYWAFVPKPLPPPLAFGYELIKALSQADRALGELAGLGRLLPDPELLNQPLMRREAMWSLRMEGIKTSLTDLYAFEAQQWPLFGVPEAPQRPADMQAVANAVTALQYGLNQLKYLPLSLRLIRELHQHLMKDARGGRARPGEFRDRQNYVGAPGCTLSEATYVPPPVEHLFATLAAFDEYLQRGDVLPPLIRAACIHYQIDALHPFLSGNGRVERLLTALLLNEGQLLPTPLLYLSAYFQRERAAYYDLLQGVSERGEWEAWLLFFLRGVTDQANDALARTKRLQGLQQHWQHAVMHAHSPNSVLRLIDRLFQSPVLTIPAVEQLLEVTDRTAQSLIHQLVDAEIVIPFDQARDRHTYVAIDVIRSVEED